MVGKNRDRRPPWTYWAIRASLDTEEEREDRFQRYLEHSKPYFAKVIANGDTPWFTSEDERRALFMRRHIRPDPPAGLPVQTMAAIRKGK